MNKNLDPQRSSVWRMFLTAHVRLVDRIQTDLKQAGLPSLEWYDILFTLTEAPEHRLRLSELADRVLLSRSNLTRLIDRLEQAGLLCRKACPSDRRGAYAVLTDAGKDMREKMWDVYSQSIAEHFGAHVSDADVDVLADVLTRLNTVGESQDNSL